MIDPVVQFLACFTLLLALVFLCWLFVWIIITSRKP
jgi:hypothetical protein